MPDKVPVDRVQGPGTPWPDSVDEVVQGEQYDREVQLADGTVTTATVTVKNIQAVTGPNGEDTGAVALTYEFADPTLDGGSG